MECWFQTANPWSCTCDTASTSSSPSGVAQTRSNYVSTIYGTNCSLVSHNLSISLVQKKQPSQTPVLLLLSLSFSLSSTTAHWYVQIPSTYVCNDQYRSSQKHHLLAQCIRAICRLVGRVVMMVITQSRTCSRKKTRIPFHRYQSIPGV